MNIILIPVIPLLAFFINIVFGKRFPKKSALISILAVFISFLLSIFVLINFSKTHEPITYNWNWIITSTTIPFGITVDGLTCIMLMVVTIVSLLVHIYSVGYMHGDPRYSRFFAFLSLFTASMLELVLANNLLAIFIGWELVGLCSYLLIGFWYEKESASNAGRKAFITTKIGDLGFFIGILLLFSLTGVFGFEEIHKIIEEGSINHTLLTISAILIFCGAIGKSAQFPLHVWLPDAMEGPTPVSALIHAATMVVAGVYMVARFYGLFFSSEQALLVVAWIGTITAFLAATIAVVTTDIKRVLAYSTLSQLGYMMLALGITGYTASIFHLATHAFFKALLFLGAGSVIHGCGVQDIREMGGLGKKMKITSITFFIAALAISGIWPFSGFYSKDEILLSAYNNNLAIYLIATFVAFLTSFYMFRLCFLTFTGEYRGKSHVHESPLVMTVPLIILAIFSIVSGKLLLVGNFFSGLVHWHGFHHPEENRIVVLVSTIVAISGIFLAWAIYVKKWINAGQIAARFSTIHKILLNKYYFDEFYQIAILNPLSKLGELLRKFDLKVIDGICVDGSAYVTWLISKAKAWFDLKFVDGSVDGIAWITKFSGGALRIIQTGFVQNYMFIIVISLSFIIIFYVL